MSRDIPIIFSAPMVRALLDGCKTMTRRLATSPLRKARPGDRLWVRESLKHVSSDPVSAEECSMHCYAASIPPGMTSANPYEPNYLFPDDGAPALKPKSVPSIHMPRWASRLTLVVTAAKIERLQSIIQYDCCSEGICDTAAVAYGFDARAAFASLWCDLHGPSGWNDNPEVVALTFRVINANIDSLPDAQAAE